jgi:hypothetical protein
MRIELPIAAAEKDQRLCCLRKLQSQNPTEHDDVISTIVPRHDFAFHRRECEVKKRHARLAETVRHGFPLIEMRLAK